MTDSDEPTTRETIDAQPSIFWRIPDDKLGWKRDRQTVSMIEIEADGGIPREISLAADGSPLDILDINWRSQFHQFSEEARLKRQVATTASTGAKVTTERFEIVDSLVM